MNRIFIEAKHKNTSEYHFIKTILNKFFPEKETDIICIDGISNLFGEPIINKIKISQDTDEQVIILADADTIEKEWGYAKRKSDIDNKMIENNISFPYFLYPNNNDDGDVELLMESLACKDLHNVFFDCFKDYENCVSGAKDDNGETRYNIPNRKGKLHTYINSQKLNNKSRKRLGSGDWLFDNENFWNLNYESLQPLKDFLNKNLK